MTNKYEESENLLSVSNLLTNQLGTSVKIHITQNQLVQGVPEKQRPLNTKFGRTQINLYVDVVLKKEIGVLNDIEIVVEDLMDVIDKLGENLDGQHGFVPGYSKDTKFTGGLCLMPPYQTLKYDRVKKNQRFSHFLLLIKKIMNRLKKMPYPLQMPPQLSPQVPQPALHNTMNNPTNFPPAQPSSASYFTSDELTTVDLDGTFYWDTYLYDENFTAVPVSSFKHAPMSECWEQMSPGMKVEVACGDEGISKDAYWVATVISVAGYKAKLRFEGFVDDDSKDFWVSLCGEGVHPVGWCATQGRPLIPPKSIQHKYKDWKEFLMRRLTGARTLPTNFMSRVAESHKSRFRPGLDVEVVDKNRIAQMRVATVTEVVGKRLHLRYHGAPQDDNGFWCHEDAPIIHPVGWSREVGHEIVASQSYHEKCITGTYDANDAVPSLFLTPPVPAYARNSKMGFTDGMKLEAIDPLNLSSICVATVMKALHNNYLMIRIDSYESDNTCSDWFCYHSTSPCIFPAGFCEMNGINLTPPRGYDGTFSWYAYLNKTKATAAPPALFNREVPQHGYAEGMALESADLMDPRLVCVANIKQVNGRLLKVHFDGWETDFDQWIDCYSSDIYPVGWCEMVGYRLEGPKVDVPTTLLSKKKFKGTKGKRGRPVGTKKIGNSRIATSQNTMLSGASTGMPGRRGRPPKYRTDSRQQDNVTQDANITQDIPPPLYTSVGSRRGRGGGGRGRDDNRRSPRSGSSISISKQESSRATNRVTNTPQSYSQSDEEEDDPMNDMDHNMSGDETSSGVASLAGSESSREPWDMMDESSQNMIKYITLLFTPEASADPTEHTLISLNLPRIQNLESRGHLVSFSLSIQNQPTPIPVLPDREEYIETSHETFNTTSCSKLSESNIRYENSPMSTTMQLAASQSSGSINEWQQQQQYNIGVSTAQELSVNGVKADALVTAASQSSAISSTLLQQEEVKQENSTKATMENTIADEPVIPRLLDGPVRGTAAGKVQPKLWTPDDVATFLTKNDCGQYCHNFVEQKISELRSVELIKSDVRTSLRLAAVGSPPRLPPLLRHDVSITSRLKAIYHVGVCKKGVTYT
ncbi:unnamed protein product, partial [Meganyctiphanes norvegica]